jgi:hypothetical protein
MIDEDNLFSHFMHNVHSGIFNLHKHGYQSDIFRGRRNTRDDECHPAHGFFTDSLHRPNLWKLFFL